MDIEDSRKCNRMNLKKVESFLGIKNNYLEKIYEELICDKDFIDAINQKVGEVRSKFGFEKGIFRMQHIPSVDWFAFERILLYVLVRHFRPKEVLETGVYYGGNSVFILLAMQKNQVGSLTSIDFPDFDIVKSGSSAGRHVLVKDSEFYDENLTPGFIIPHYLRDKWNLIIGDSLEVIPSLDQKFNLYIHDSEHSMKFLSKELKLASMKIASDGIMVVDDIDWSNAFFAFCVESRLSPLLLTDNGKDDLRVRTGLVDLGHERNGQVHFT